MGGCAKLTTAPILSSSMVRGGTTIAPLEAREEVSPPDLGPPPLQMKVSLLWASSVTEP